MIGRMEFFPINVPQGFFGEQQKMDPEEERLKKEQEDEDVDEQNSVIVVALTDLGDTAGSPGASTRWLCANHLGKDLNSLMLDYSRWSYDKTIDTTFILTLYLTLVFFLKQLTDI